MVDVVGSQVPAVLDAALLGLELNPRDWWSFLVLRVQPGRRRCTHGWFDWRSGLVGRLAGLGWLCRVSLKDFLQVSGRHGESRRGRSSMQRGSGYVAVHHGRSWQYRWSRDVILVRLQHGGGARARTRSAIVLLVAETVTVYISAGFHRAQPSDAAMLWMVHESMVL